MLLHIDTLNTLFPVLLCFALIHALYFFQFKDPKKRFPSTFSLLMTLQKEQGTGALFTGLSIIF
jgi:hypothetical protein